MHLLCLDETGDHSLARIDKDFPIFVLCGCVFEENYLKENLISKVNKLKKEFFGTKKVILHSRDIRKWQKHFWIFNDPNLRDRFYKKLDKLVSEADFRIIAVVIKKREYLKEFGPKAGDPYEVSLGFVLERFIFFLDDINENKSKLIVESRGRKEDQDLHREYQTILGSGTHYVESKRYNLKITGIDFVKKKENHVGLQFADLIAYPLAQKILFPERENLAFEVFENKFYRRFKDEDYLGYGLKIYP